MRRAFTWRRVPAWTDWNSHDPGVTVLEALVYTLADLAHELRPRLYRDRCGWRCAVIIATTAAGAAIVVRHVMSERNERRRRL